MLHRAAHVLLAASVALTLTACSSSEPELALDPALAELEAWKATQTEQECPDVAQDQAVLDLVSTAMDSGDVTNVYGEDDPYGRVDPVKDHLWSRPDPAGDGVVVTAVQDGEQVGLNEASRARHRAVWLVLDGMIYPLNVDASGSHGLLLSGLPANVASRAGLPQHAIDTERDLGIEDYISFRWHGSEDPLPACE